jgi:hypothetical protein
MSFAADRGWGILQTGAKDLIAFLCMIYPIRELKNLETQQVILMDPQTKICISDMPAKMRFGFRIALVLMTFCMLSAMSNIDMARGQNGFQVPDFKNANPFGKSAPFGKKSNDQVAAEDPVTLSATFSSNGDGT